MARRKARQELTRDEVWVPPLHELPEEWERNNAYFDYRVRRLAPGWTVLSLGAGLLLVAALALGRAGPLAAALLVALFVAEGVTLLAAFVRRRR